MGIGGHATDIASKADQLREAVISDLRSAFAGDEETLSNIEKADTYHKDNVRKFYIPVIAQMRRENSPILEEEIIATVLSEDPSLIAIFMNSLPEDSRALVEMEGLKMLQEMLMLFIQIHGFRWVRKMKRRKGLRYSGLIRLQKNY